MRIAVLGGGHGSYAAAADLAEQGHEVRLWRRDAAAFAPVLQSGAIRLKDVKGSRRAWCARSSTSSPT
jgi:opine dehydrogenase